MPLWKVTIAALAVLAPTTIWALDTPDAAPALPVSEQPLALADGLAEAAWPGALRIERFFEISPGDNTPDTTGTTAFLIRDAHHLLIAFHMDDPDPARIRAPFSARDNIFGDQDFVQIDIDFAGDGRSSRIYRINPRGVQADGVYSESTALDDFSPDHTFESLARVGPDGWAAVLRIPLSTLPESTGAPDAPLRWLFVVYRNRPRQFRHQIASSRMPRGTNCWLCHAASLSVDPIDAPGERSFTPYVTGRRRADTVSPSALTGDVGLDARWRASRAATIDATINPDFSQVESDVPQLDVNTRFALAYQEKRPFFMPAVELLATPIPAVYTRSISQPGWGARATGHAGGVAFTALVADDRGGGSVVVPGAAQSDLAPQDFSSVVSVARARLVFGAWQPGALFTSREIEGGGYNRVAGPDLEWRPRPEDQVRAQWLAAWTATPSRPDLHPTWDGRRLTSSAAGVEWLHAAPRASWSLAFRDVGDDFRADVGFVPQVGYRQWAGHVAWAWYPSGAIRLVQPQLSVDRQTRRDGSPLARAISPGLAFEGLWGTTGLVAYHPRERVPTDRGVAEVDFVQFAASVQPPRVVSSFALEGRVGEDVDLASTQVGHGASVSADVVIRPADRLEVEIRGERRWLNMDRTGTAARSFTGAVWRVKSTWHFSVASFLRLVAEREVVRRDRTAGPGGRAWRDATFEASALFGYRVTWRTVLFVGYGTRRAESPGEAPRPVHQAFVKMAYEIAR